MVAGVVIALTNTTTQLSGAQLNLHELSGYLDATNERLKRDIWSAVDTQTAGAPAPCPALGATVTLWMALDLNPAGLAATDVCYTIDTTDANDIRLMRRSSGINHVMAHHVVLGTTPIPTVAGRLVTFKITVSKTTPGRTYTRSLNAIRYHLQTPP